jgi:hypothetical protein
LSNLGRIAVIPSSSGQLSSALVAVTAVMLSTIILHNPRVIIYVRIMGIQAATSYSKSQVQQTYSEQIPLGTDS